MLEPKVRRCIKIFLTVIGLQKRVTYMKTTLNQVAANVSAVYFIVCVEFCVLSGHGDISGVRIDQGRNM